jgi:hypothetical protein
MLLQVQHKSAEKEFKGKREESPKKDTGLSLTEGYFVQPGKSSDKKKIKQVHEMFDNHDYTNSKGNTILSFLKMG